MLYSIKRTVVIALRFLFNFCDLFNALRLGLSCLFSSGKLFCGFKLNLAFYNHSVAHSNYLFQKTYFKRIILRLVQIKFHLFTVIFMF